VVFVLVVDSGVLVTVAWVAEVDGVGRGALEIMSAELT